MKKPLRSIELDMEPALFSAYSEQSDSWSPVSEKHKLSIHRERRGGASFWGFPGAVVILIIIFFIVSFGLYRQYYCSHHPSTCLCLRSQRHITLDIDLVRDGDVHYKIDTIRES